MKKIIALLLAVLVIVASGCLSTVPAKTGANVPNQAVSNPIADAFGGASNPVAGSPPAMPGLPGLPV